MESTASSVLRKLRLNRTFVIGLAEDILETDRDYGVGFLSQVRFVCPQEDLP
jgi:hypothetical protein